MIFIQVRYYFNVFWLFQRHSAFIEAIIFIFYFKGVEEILGRSFLKIILKLLFNSAMLHLISPTFIIYHYITLYEQAK